MGLAHEEDTKVRIVVRDGEPWFVLVDVCRVLEIGNPADVHRRLDTDEKGIDSIETPGGSQKMTIISESGLYNVIFLSRKDTAKRFRKWVTSEVLPMIRKTGGVYMSADRLDQFLNDPASLRSLLSEYAEKLIEAQPKVDFYDNYIDASGLFGLRAAGKRVPTAL